MTTFVDTGCYVFGIVDAGARLQAPLDIALASGLRLVEWEKVAAVVGTPPTDRPLGRAADLIDHDRVLADLAANGTSVLPMRFGTVFPDDDAISAELIAPRHDELLAQLDTIRGKVQFTIRARFDEESALREVVERYPDIARMRAKEGGSFDHRVKLGERVVAALAELRAEDAPRLLEELGDAGSRREYPPSSPEEVAHVAYLVDTGESDAFVQRVEEAGERHAGRIRIRLVGPSPAYNFVGDG